MNCPQYEPECIKGRVTELRFKGMSYLLMCNACKQARLRKHPELIPYQRGRRYNDAPIEQQSEFRNKD